MFELVSRFGLAPLRVVLVRAVPCTCAKVRRHTAGCAVTRAPHPQQVMLEGVIFGRRRFRFVSAAVLEPASTPAFAAAA